MAFTVEDGTVVAGANSFATVDGADTYFEDRGNATWAAATDTNKETALVRATDYINNRFRFRGEKYDEDQPLEFPRVYDDAESPEMPDKLIYATYEYAVRALGDALAPDPEIQDNGQQVISHSEEVGPIREATMYRATGSIIVWRPYPLADILLRDLILNGRRVIR
jgi:hypothetical protein